MIERPKVITDLLAADNTGTVANYIRKLEAEIKILEVERDAWMRSVAVLEDDNDDLKDEVYKLQELLEKLLAK
ncbi:MAG: hypothetical protein ABWY25_06990 [Paenisporosarcina sp.]|jgi:hypothetical protein